MTIFSWSTPGEQPPGPGATPQEVAEYIEDELFGEFLWELPDDDRLKFLEQLCKQNGWSWNEVARCLRDGPLAVVAGRVTPADDTEAQPDPHQAGYALSPFDHAAALVASGTELAEVIAYLQSSSCHPFDIGRLFRWLGIDNEAFHRAARGVLPNDLAESLRGLLWELPPPPYPKVLPSFDGQDRQKLVVTNPATHVLARQAWNVANQKNDPTQLLTFGSDPVRVKANHDGPPRLEPITKNTLLHIHHRLISWGRWKEDMDGEKYWEECEPPSRVVDDMMGEPHPPFPPLVGFRAAPVFGPKGTLALGPGYDPGSRTFIWSPRLKVPFVPLHPSPTDIAMARHLLEVEVFGGFPFDDEASLAHTIAAVLQPFVRPMISGPTPIHVFDKPKSGTGATLLADAISFIVLGHGPELMTEGKLEDEWRWRMLAALQSGTPIILFDNLKQKLDSGTVSAIVTRPDTYSGRMVGSGKNVTVPVRVLWLLTANNMQFSHDNARRSVLIRLDTNLENPESGRTYLHYPLLPWITENRGRLVWAALVLVQAWIAAGRPTGKVTKGSFESWAEVMGGILEVVGIPGFLANEDKLKEYADDDDPRWTIFVTAWLETFGTKEVKSSALLWLADEHLDLSGESGRSQSTRWGQMLKAKRDAVFVGHKIRSCGTRQGAAVWRLEPVNVK